jgi:hypothetical protein
MRALVQERVAFSHLLEAILTGPHHVCLGLGLDWPWRSGGYRWHSGVVCGPASPAAGTRHLWAQYSTEGVEPRVPSVGRGQCLEFGAFLDMFDGRGLASAEPQQRGPLPGSNVLGACLRRCGLTRGPASSERAQCGLLFSQSHWLKCHHGLPGHFTA